ncbi:MAG: 16S rRNA (adenine(1518)-N(6)/adenine(1519)-N(6))-dimethyltransferase RsmA [Bacillota bacterium]
MKRIIATSGETKRLINQHKFRIKKSLGQNFIIEPRIIDGIVEAAGLTARDIAVEIGPGMGSLTQGLAAAAGQVLAVELDKTLIPILRDSFADYDNVSIVHGDALKVNYNELLAPLLTKGDYDEGFVVVANLPYYITTPITMNLLEGGYPWRRLVLMVQKEVANRMKAQPGTKDYGALSVGVQYRAAAKIAMHIPPTVFIPRPAVDSAIIVLDRLPQPAVKVRDEKLFFRLVAAAFGQRRKTLGNSVSGGLHLEKTQVSAALAKAEIAAERRGETLSLEEFARLADALTELNSEN